MVAFGGRALSPNADLTHNARVAPSGPFVPGELVMLLDPDGKSFLVRLNDQDSLHHHKGAVRLVDLIGVVADMPRFAQQLLGARERLLDGLLCRVR